MRPLCRRVWQLLATVSISSPVSPTAAARHLPREAEMLRAHKNLHTVFTADVHTHSEWGEKERERGGKTDRMRKEKGRLRERKGRKTALYIQTMNLISTKKK